MHRRPCAPSERGFTQLELTIVATIFLILASIGVPQYATALRHARVGKAKHELVSISHAIDAFTANHDGLLPLTLYQVGFGGQRDPWGTPYCYVNYADGSGDGLHWAIAPGLVESAAFGPVIDGDSGGEPGVAAVADRIGRPLTGLERAALSRAVAANGTFGLFLGVDAEKTRRRDRYMFPVNTDFDLFSIGPDRRSAPSLGEDRAADDVIRANNGGFFGSASEY